MPERVLVLGGSGLVGSSFVDLLKDQLEIIAPVSTEVDVLKLDQVAQSLKSIRPSSILYAIGYTNVDKAEQEADLAQALNVDGIKNVTNVAADLKIPVYYYSTDFVFDGRSTDRPYQETDTPNPLSVYGQTKFKGEKVALAASSDNGVIRLTMPYAAQFDKKLDIARAMLGRLKDGQPIKAVTDQKINPSYIADVAFATAKILEDKQTGIWHLGASNFVSPYQFAEQLAQACQINLELVTQTTFVDYSAGRPAQRPQFSWLDPTKFINQFGAGILHTTEEGLEQFANDLARLA